MTVTYEKEIEALKLKLTQKVGSDKVMELEAKILKNKQKQDEMLKKIREHQKKVNDTAKIFEKQSGVRDSGSEISEEKRLLKTINNECEKTKALEGKLKAENDTIVSRDEKTKQITSLIEKLEEEINGLKNEARTVAEAAGNTKKEEKESTDKNALKESIKEAQDQIEAEAQKYKKEMQEEKATLKNLQDKFKEIDQVKP